MTVDHLIGATLPGRFRIDAEMGRGGFGVVYRAHQLAVGRDVAIKVLHPTIAPTSREGRAFVQEIQAVGRIDHPNVVRIFQAETSNDGRLFYAMELLHGHDLEQVRSSQGPLAPEHALTLIGQLLGGLGAVHAAGLVHADIKPANALVCETATGPRLVLVDFGLARLRRTDQATRALGGTPAYMAPEQLDHGRVDARSDLFAVGLLLLTLLTGWRRTSRDVPAAALAAISSDRLRAAVARALDPDPDARFQSADEFARALVAPPSRRRRVVAIIALAAALATTAGIARAVWPAAALPPRPTVRVVGSDSVLHGALAPARDVIEREAEINLPLLDNQDQGSRGAIPALAQGTATAGARSERFTAALPPYLPEDTVLIEVAVGYDQIALFVPRSSPVRTLDLADVRTALCCSAGEHATPRRWSDVAPGTNAPGDVTWLLFGRRAPPTLGDTTSSTLRNADAWLCAPQQLCAAPAPYDGSFRDLLATVAATPTALGLSTRSFPHAEVRVVDLVDRAGRLRFDGRRPLWLYLAGARDRPLPATTCRFLRSILGDATAVALTRAERAVPLSADLRAHQRAWLGLDDGRCGHRPVGELGAPAGGLARSPVGDAVESPPWVPLIDPPQ